MVQWKGCGIDPVCEPVPGMRVTLSHGQSHGGHGLGRDELQNESDSWSDVRTLVGAEY